MAIKTIKVQGCTTQKEFIAGGTVTPGMLLKRTSVANTAIAHGTAGGTCQKMFAIEDELQGKEITENYSSTNRMQVVFPQRGDVVLALLADGENVAVGDFLVSNGAGRLAKLVAASSGVAEYADAVVGVAMEAVDMSGSAGADPSGRIQVEIL